MMLGLCFANVAANWCDLSHGPAHYMTNSDQPLVAPIANAVSNAPASSPDLSGQRHVVRNVAMSWLGQLVFMVTGFIMPRMVDSHLGQTSLGIWDFSWSLVNYFGVASLGIGSSVNRYVAMYRAEGETAKLRRAISSVVLTQSVIGLLVLLLSGTLAWGLPYFFPSHAGPHLQDAQWVVGLLGATLAFQMGLDAFRGVITGCHRWDYHNGLHSGAYLVALIAMILALKSGYGLIGLAAAYSTVFICAELLRVALAFKVCPELRVAPRYATHASVKEMMRFGGKTLVLATPQMLAVQTINPAMLAVLARPMALSRLLDTFLGKFSYVLTPMVSSMQAHGTLDELRKFLLINARWGAALAIPPTLVLMLLGDSILELWMGPDYVHKGLLPLLAGGLFFATVQGPLTQTLIGLNAHGRVALIAMGSVFVILAGGFITLHWVGWSLMGAALLVVTAIAIPYGFIVPILACRKLDIALHTYLLQAFGIPAACGLVVAGLLAIIRLSFAGHPVKMLMCGSVCTALLTGTLYWLWLLNGEQRAGIQRLLLRPFAA
jgi:O-antigen/teichoic acid export membrane protein